MISKNEKFINMTSVTTPDYVGARVWQASRALLARLNDIY